MWQTTGQTNERMDRQAHSYNNDNVQNFWTKLDFVAKMIK